MKIKGRLGLAIGLLLFLSGCGCSEKRFVSREFKFEIIPPPGWHKTFQQDLLSMELNYAKSKRSPDQNPQIHLSVQPEMGYDAKDYLQKILLPEMNMESKALDDFPVELIEPPVITEWNGLSWAQTLVQLKNEQKNIYVLVTDHETFIFTHRILGDIKPKEDNRIFRKVWMSFKLLKS